MNAIRQLPWILGLAAVVTTVTPVVAHPLGLVDGYYVVTPSGYPCHYDHYSRWVCQTSSYYHGSFGSALFGYSWGGHGNFGHRDDRHSLGNRNWGSHHGWYSGHGSYGGGHGSHHDAHH